MDNKYYVYLHKRADSGSIFYVGKGSGNRAYEARYRNTYWQRVVAKHEFTVEIFRSGMTESEALALEKRLIQYYGRDNLTNMTDGGEGATNPSLETRRKHSEAMKQRMASPEYRARLAASHVAISHSPEYKRRMSENNPMRDKEVSRKVALANTGPKNKMARRIECKEAGICFLTYSYAVDWLKLAGKLKAHPGNLSTAVRTGCTAYSYHWYSF